MSGIAAWAKRMKPDCQVIGLEPEQGGAMGPSLRAGHLVRTANADTVADGLRIEQVCELTLLHAAKLVDDVIGIPDRDIVVGSAQLLRAGKLVVELAGGIGVGAVLSGRWQAHGRRTAIVLSGGNIDPARIADLCAL